MAQMLYDMEDYSDFSTPFDSLGVISHNPSPDKIIEGQIINTIVPHSLSGEVYENVGDTFTYCVSSLSPKKFGDFKYKSNSCQIKFKLRAMASFNKLPG